MTDPQKTDAYTKQSPETIQKMFGSIAERYDRANAVMSFNMHKLWNAKLVKEVAGTQQHPRALDLCCGTGDIIFELLKKQTLPCTAHCLDFCPEMLQCAQIKSKTIPGIDRHHLSFIHGDAQQIPLDDRSVDCVTIAYGIRNVKDPSLCMREAYRVLDQGGIFGILELTIPSNPFLRLGHRFYLKNILPLIGKFVSDNQMAYEYLCQSIHAFTPPERLIKMLDEARFTEIKKISLMGGIATLVTARKSSDQAG